MELFIVDKPKLYSGFFNGNLTEKNGLSVRINVVFQRIHTPYGLYFYLYYLSFYIKEEKHHALYL
jgi:hypothetical protein